MADRSITLVQVRQVNAIGEVSWRDSRAFYLSGAVVTTGEYYTPDTVVRVQFVCSPLEYWRLKAAGGWEQVKPRAGHRPENYACVWDPLKPVVTYAVERVYGNYQWRAVKKENGVTVCVLGEVKDQLHAQLLVAAAQKERIVVGSNRDGKVTCVKLPPAVAAVFEGLHVAGDSNPVGHPSHSVRYAAAPYSQDNGTARIGKLGPGSLSTSAVRALEAYDKL